MDIKFFPYNYIYETTIQNTYDYKNILGETSEDKDKNKEQLVLMLFEQLLSSISKEEQLKILDEMLNFADETVQQVLKKLLNYAQGLNDDNSNEITQNKDQNQLNEQELKETEQEMFEELDKNIKIEVCDFSEILCELDKEGQKIKTELLQKQEEDLNYLPDDYIGVAIEQK